MGGVHVPGLIGQTDVSALPGTTLLAVAAGAVVAVVAAVAGGAIAVRHFASQGYRERKEEQARRRYGGR